MIQRSRIPFWPFTGALGQPRAHRADRADRADGSGARSAGITRTMTLCIAFGQTVANSSAQSGPKTQDSRVQASAVAASSGAQALQLMRAAHALVRLGDARQDALLLLAAAALLRQADANPVALQHRAEPGEAPSPKAGSDRFDRLAVLDRAQRLTTDRPDLLALIEDHRRSGARGAPQGPSRWVDIVMSGQATKTPVVFKAGEPALVAVSGDGDSDLDLFVLDAKGQVVCRDEGDSDDMACGWTPKETGEYVIIVRNLGISNRYVAMHN